MSKPLLFGADYSVYVRIVRLTLIEKGIDYDLVPVDVFAAGGPPASHFARQPFGRIPAFEQEDFSLYETSAIVRYVDESFAGPPLQPSEVKGRARMSQLMSIADSYLYPVLVWGVYVEQVSKPEDGREVDPSKLVASLKQAAVCLTAVETLIAAEDRWLCGGSLSLADIYVAPMLDYFVRAPAAAELMATVPKLAEWWTRMAARPSMEATAPVAEV